MPKCVIKRYYMGTTLDLPMILNGHVTITGQEDHFALAHHDANMIIRGMREADKSAFNDPDAPGPSPDAPRYWIHSVSLD